MDHLAQKGLRDQSHLLQSDQKDPMVQTARLVLWHLHLLAQRGQRDPKVRLYQHQ